MRGKDKENDSIISESCIDLGSGLMLIRAATDKRVAQLWVTRQGLEQAFLAETILVRDQSMANIRKRLEEREVRERIAKVIKTNLLFACEELGEDKDAGDMMYVIRTER